MEGTDCTPTFLQFFEDCFFDSWAEFEDKFDAFQETTGTVFKPKCATTVQYENKKRKNQIPEKFKYAMVKMVCIHSGNPVDETKSVVRKGRSYLAQGCPAYVNVCYSKGLLKITKFDLHHQNHVLHAQKNRFYSRKRKYAQEHAQDLQDLRDDVQDEEDQKPGHELLEYIENNTRKVINRDLNSHNLKMPKPEKIMYSSISDSVERLQETGRVEVEMLESGKLVNIISFTTHELMNTCRTFPEVLFIDGVHSPNKFGYQLFQILIFDNLGKTRPVFFSFVRSECEENLSKVLEHFTTMMGNDVIGNVLTCIVEGDQILIEQVKIHLPQVSVLLCKHYVMKRFKDRVWRLDISTPEKEEIMGILGKLVNSQDESSFNETLKKLERLSVDIYCYIHSNWMMDRVMWVKHFRHHVTHLGNNVINYRADVLKLQKQKILRSSETLARCVDNLVAYSQIICQESIFEITQALPPQIFLTVKDERLHGLYKNFTEYAIHCMTQDHQGLSECDCREVTEQGYEVLARNHLYIVSQSTGKCTCYFHIQYLLPCVHTVFLWLQDKLPTDLLLSGSRWLKSVQAGKIKIVRTPANILPKKSSKTTPQHQNKTVEDSQRSEKVEEVCQQLTECLSRCDTDQFNQRIEQLQLLASHWESDQEIVLMYAAPTESSVTRACSTSALSHCQSSPNLSSPVSHHLQHCQSSEDSLKEESRFHGNDSESREMHGNDSDSNVSTNGLLSVTL